MVLGTEGYFVDANWSPTRGWPLRYTLGMRVPVGEGMRLRLGGGVGIGIRQPSSPPGLWPVMPLVVTGLLTGSGRAVFGVWIVVAHQRAVADPYGLQMTAQIRAGYGF